MNDCINVLFISINDLLKSINDLLISNTIKFSFMIFNKRCIDINLVLLISVKYLFISIIFLLINEYMQRF